VSAPTIQEAAARLVLIANVGEEGEGNLSGMRHLAGQSAARASYPCLAGARRPFGRAHHQPGAGQAAASRSCSPAPAATVGAIPATPTRSTLSATPSLVHRSVPPAPGGPERGPTAAASRLLKRGGAPRESSVNSTAASELRRAASTWLARTARRTELRALSAQCSSARCNSKTSARGARLTAPRCQGDRLAPLAVLPELTRRFWSSSRRGTPEGTDR